MNKELYVIYGIDGESKIRVFYAGEDITRAIRSIAICNREKELSCSTLDWRHK